MLPLLGGIMAGGALMGGISGASAANQNARNIRGATNAINSIQGRVGGYDPATGTWSGQAGDVYNYAANQYSPYTQSAAADMANFRSLAGQDPSQFYFQEADPYSYNMDQGIQSFMDPSMEFQIREATRAVEGSAANAGKLFSSSTGKGIADRSQEIARQSWKEALQAALQDRAYGASEHQRAIDNARAVQAQKANIWGQQAGLQGQLANMGFGATQALANTGTQALSDAYRTMNDADLAKANMLMQRGPGMLGGFAQGAASTLGPASGLMASYFGAKG